MENKRQINYGNAEPKLGNIGGKRILTVLGKMRRALLERKLALQKDEQILDLNGDKLMKELDKDLESIDSCLISVISSECTNLTIDSDSFTLMDDIMKIHFDYIRKFATVNFLERIFEEELTANLFQVLPFAGQLNTNGVNGNLQQFFSECAGNNIGGKKCLNLFEKLRGALSERLSVLEKDLEIFNYNREKLLKELDSDLKNIDSCLISVISSERINHTIDAKSFFQMQLYFIRKAVVPFATVESLSLIFAEEMKATLFEVLPFSAQRNPNEMIESQQELYHFGDKGSVEVLMKIRQVIYKRKLDLEKEVYIFNQHKEKLTRDLCADLRNIDCSITCIPLLINSEWATFINDSDSFFEDMTKIPLNFIGELVLPFETKYYLERVYEEEIKANLFKVLPFSGQLNVYTVLNAARDYHFTFNPVQLEVLIEDVRNEILGEFATYSTDWPPERVYKFNSGSSNTRQIIRMKFETLIMKEKITRIKICRQQRDTYFNDIKRLSLLFQTLCDKWHESEYKACIALENEVNRSYDAVAFLRSESEKLSHETDLLITDIALKGICLMRRANLEHYLVSAEELQRTELDAHNEEDDIDEIPSVSHEIAEGEMKDDEQSTPGYPEINTEEGGVEADETETLEAEAFSELFAESVILSMRKRLETLKELQNQNRIAYDAHKERFSAKLAQMKETAARIANKQITVPYG